MMTVTNTLCPLSSLDEFDPVLARSLSRPILIFKHSPPCGIRAGAYDEIAALLEDQPISADVYFVDVRAARPVSNVIPARLGVRHESPQALLVDHGQVRWSAPHFRVTARALPPTVSKLFARCARSFQSRSEVLHHRRQLSVALAWEAIVVEGLVG